jgi:hypothetical protein
LGLRRKPKNAAKLTSGIGCLVCLSRSRGAKWFNPPLTYLFQKADGSSVMRFALLVFIFDTDFKNIWIY